MKFVYCALWYYTFWIIPTYSWKPIKNVRIGLGEPNSVKTTNTTCEDKWFVQKLDHYNPTEYRTWNQVLKHYTYLRTNKLKRLQFNRVTKLALNLFLEVSSKPGLL